MAPSKDSRIFGRQRWKAGTSKGSEVSGVTTLGDTDIAPATTSAERPTQKLGPHSINSGHDPVPAIDSSSYSSSSSPRRGLARLNSSSRTRPREVTFGDVVVRHYSQTLGDNPACSYGAPITLDWTYVQLEPKSVDLYEALRLRRRRPAHQLILSYYFRRELLLALGFDERDIQRTTREISKLRVQRQKTEFFSHVWKVEDAVETTGRRLKRVVNISNKEPSVKPARSLFAQQA